MKAGRLQDLRDAVAVNVRDALIEHYSTNQGTEVSLGQTTSGCPLIRLDLGDGYVFHVTVTRARS